MIELASFDQCTGCGACAYVCPKSCIEMINNAYGVIYPVIDKDRCIECGKCMRSCPAISPLQQYTHKQSYAAWNKNEEDRSNSASGGIATAIYNYALDNGWYIVGASMDENFVVSLQVTNKNESLGQFQNSKYVFSNPYSSYREIEVLLKKGYTIVIVALPCQIAAYKKIFIEYDNVYYIDLICHGVIPSMYLQKYIEKVENNNKVKARKMYFRDPAYCTDTYTFTLYNQEGHCFYKKKVIEDSLYQKAYHDSIAYRENCYHCFYANPKRISDITLGDYYGLGEKSYFDFSKKKVSCLLVNTEKGEKLLEKLIEVNLIMAIKRPFLEPIDGNRMLKTPCVKSRKRRYFEYYIVKFNGDFNLAMSAVIERYSKWEKIQNFILYLKRMIKQKIGWKK